MEALLIKNNLPDRLDYQFDRVVFWIWSGLPAQNDYFRVGTIYNIFF